MIVELSVKLPIPVSWPSLPVALRQVAAPGYLPGIPNDSRELGGKVPGIALVWMRTDLRLHDHPALIEACETYAQVLPVFLVRKDGRSAFDNGKKLGPQELEFMLEALEDVQRSLVERGGCLLIELEEETAAAALVSTVERLDDRVRAVLFHRGSSAYERREEDEAVNALQKLSVRHGSGSRRLVVRGLASRTICEVEKLPIDGVQSLPDNCDEFGELVSDISPPNPLPAPSAVRSPSVELLKEQGLHPNGVQWIRDQLKHWSPPSDHIRAGESVALEMVEKYVRGQSLGSVLTSRGLRPPFGKFNHFLAWGCVSPRFIYHEVRERLPKTSIRRHCAEYDLILRDFIELSTLKCGAFPA